MTDPERAIRPATTMARNNVNNQYAGLADRLRQQFLTTGGGKSGKMGMAMLAGELGRGSALADVDNQAAVTASQLPISAAQLAEQWLGMNFGQTTDSRGSYTGPGDPLTGALQGGFGAAASAGGLIDVLSKLWGKRGDGTNASNSTLDAQYKRGW